MIKLIPQTPHSTVVVTENGEFLFSFGKVVAAQLEDGRTLRTATPKDGPTVRHINAWIGRDQGQIIPQEQLEKLCK